MLGNQCLGQFQHGFQCLGVERHKGFVHDQKLRIARKGARQGKPALLTQRQLAGIHCALAAKTDLGQRLIQPFAGKTGMNDPKVVGGAAPRQ